MKVGPVEGALDGSPPEMAEDLDDEIFIPLLGGPPFPTRALPSVLAEFIAAEAERLQVPEDLIAMLALPVIATAAQRSYFARVRDGWTEPCSLYTAVGLPPADRKSAAKRAVCRALRSWENEQTTNSSGRGEEQEPPARVVVEDVTGEALARQLSLHESLGLFSAEAGTFDRMAGRYRSNRGDGDTDVYLAAHAGDSITVDRVKTGTIRVEHPALSIGLAIQPATLRNLSAVPGAASRGLLARFLYSLPRSRVGQRHPIPAPTPRKIRDAFETCVRGILEGYDGGPRKPLRFDPDVQTDIVDLLEEIEPRLGPGGDLEPLHGWGGKLVGAIARIATLLQLVEHAGSTGVRRTAVRRAMQLVDYLIEHARLAFNLMNASDPGEALCDPVVAVIVDLATKARRWRASELLEVLKRADVPRNRIPGGAVAMAYELNRLVPTLTGLGVEVGKRDRRRARLICRRK